MGGTRVLIVEPQAGVARLLHAFLARLGCDVRIAAAAPAALELLRSGPFDVVLADEDVDGLGVLGARAPGSVGILMTAGLADADLRARAKSVAAAILLKPFRLEALGRFLDRA